MTRSRDELERAARAAVLAGSLASGVATGYVVYSEMSTGRIAPRRALGRVSDRLPLWAGVAGAVGALGGAAIGSRRRRRPDSAGSARWAAPSDVADLLLPRGARAPRDGFTLGKMRSRLVALDRKASCTHTLILGPTGAGKTRGFLLPNLDHARTDSFVVTDPKGEIHDCTARFHARVRRYAPLEPEASVSFNWVPRCSDPAIARLLGRVVIMQDRPESSAGESFWPDGESLLAASLFAHAATTDDPTPRGVLALLTGLGPEELVETLIASPSRTARTLIAAMRHGDDKRLRAGMLTGVAQSLLFLADDRIKRFTSSTDEGSDFSELRSWPVGVYWVLPHQDVAMLKGLTSMFLSLMLYDIKRAAGSTGVTMILDEVGNVGQIPDLASDITLVRDLNIAFVLCTQSLSQLVTVYGRERARTIVDNCLTLCVLRGLRYETAEEVSRALGEQTVFASSDGSSTSTSGGWLGKVSRSRSNNETERSRRLLTADEVRCLPETKAIIIHNNRPPMLVDRHHSTLTRPTTAAARPATGATRRRRTPEK